MENTNTLKNISLDHLFAHPDNPRKDLGDLSEISESIKSNGIMQNITAIPKEDGAEGDYTVLIGHRRCEAARLAGLTEVPCKVVEGLTRAEQIEIMLCENMQRADITAEEQAASFQQLLLFGLTEEDIARKTGFSRRTVQHRLNIAKLDQETIKKNGFQLSFSDYAELEKIDDINVRNEILSKSATSADLCCKVKQYIDKKAVKDSYAPFIAALKEAGIKEAPKSYRKYSGSNEYKEIKECRIGKSDATTFLDDIDKEDKDIRYYVDEYSYNVNYNSILILKYDRDAIQAKNDRKAKEDERKARENELKNKENLLNEHLCAFIRTIVDGKAKTSLKFTEVINKLWSYMVSHSVSINRTTLLNQYDSEKFPRYMYREDADLKEEGDKVLASLSMAKQMFFCILNSVRTTVSFNGYYRNEYAASVKDLVEILEFYGFVYDDGEEELVNGTSDLFEKVSTTTVNSYDDDDEDDDDEDYDEDEDILEDDNAIEDDTTDTTVA